MNKVAYQGAGVVVLFLAIWLGLSQINWVYILNVNETAKNTEEKLGELLWDIFKGSEKTESNDTIIGTLDSLLQHICTENMIDAQQIQLHVIRKDEINAFALPNRQIVVYTGLIDAAESEAELCGVICHELAHIELNHIMKKLIKEVGLSVLITMTTGNSGAEVLKETARILSSSAYDRSLEREADIKAVDFMQQANINAEAYAEFLFKLSTNQNKYMEKLTWISSHPEIKERAKYVIEYSQKKPSAHSPILSLGSWEDLKTAVNN